MTKNEAIEAMQRGLRIAHSSFTDDEWMCLTDNGSYQFEDDVICSPELFWFDRSGPEWNEGWSVRDDKLPLSPDVGPILIHNPYKHFHQVAPALKRGAYVNVRTEPKVYRNELCPCGSELKYKKCCIIKE